MQKREFLAKELFCRPVDVPVARGESHSGGSLLEPHVLELGYHGVVVGGGGFAAGVGGTPMLSSLEEYLLVVGVLAGHHCILELST